MSRSIRPLSLAFTARSRCGHPAWSVPIV